MARRPRAPAADMSAGELIVGGRGAARSSPADYEGQLVTSLCLRASRPPLPPGCPSRGSACALRTTHPGPRPSEGLGGGGSVAARPGSAPCAPAAAEEEEQS